MAEAEETVRRRLPLIVPESYCPHTWEYIPAACQPRGDSLNPAQEQNQADMPPLEQWMEIFYRSIEYFASIARRDPSIDASDEDKEGMADSFAASYRAHLDDIMARVKLAGASFMDNVALRMECTCLHLCRLREECLIEAGFGDPFVRIKHEENMKSLDLLPGVCREIDSIMAENGKESDVVWTTVLKNVCAANIFDLGSEHTKNMYHDDQDGVCFHSTRQSLPRRPWAIDDVDKFCSRMKTHTYTKAMIFVDNSGSDVLLGIVPFARLLLSAGACKEVVLAANSHPSINDITFNELDALLPRICEVDDRLCSYISSQRLRIIPSGNGLPVIDLASPSISDQVYEEAEDTDLLILEGMGRSIETNLYATMAVDCMKIGMVKHPEVATCLQTTLMNCVVKFDLAKVSKFVLQGVPVYADASQLIQLLREHFKLMVHSAVPKERTLEGSSYAKGNVKVYEYDEWIIEIETPTPLGKQTLIKSDQVDMRDLTLFPFTPEETIMRSP